MASWNEHDILEKHMIILHPHLQIHTRRGRCETGLSTASENPGEL